MNIFLQKISMISSKMSHINSLGLYLFVQVLVEWLSVKEIVVFEALCGKSQKTFISQCFASVASYHTLDGPSISSAPTQLLDWLGNHSFTMNSVDLYDSSLSSALDSSTDISRAKRVRLHCLRQSNDANIKAVL